MPYPFPATPMTVTVLIRGLFSIILVAAASPAAAQGRILIGEGALVDTGSGAIDLGCASLTVEGRAGGVWTEIDSVAAGPNAELTTTRIDFGGDWRSAAGLQAVSGQVNWRQQCERSEGSLLGSNRFQSLSITSTTGVVRRVDASGQQVINQSLRIEGGTGPVVLRSTVNGQGAPLTVEDTATWTILGADVGDINSSGGQPLTSDDPTRFQAVDSGGNSNWFISALPMPVPVPLLSGVGLLVLLLLVFLLGGRHLSAGLPSPQTI